MFFSGEVSGDPGDCCAGETSAGAQLNNEEVVTHNIEEFHNRLLSSVRVTEERALKSNILEKKRKRKVVDSISQVKRIDYEKAKTMATRIVSDIMLNNKEEKSGPCIEIEDEPIQDIELPKTVLSPNRQSSTTAKDLSERWGLLSLAQAALTLKATTQKLTRLASMPLARRYCANRMFDVRHIHGTMSTDTMDLRCKSLNGDQYSQVFGNKQLFVEGYPIEKKLEGLDKCVREYGAPDKFVYDGGVEQVGRKTEFQRLIRKYKIKGHTIEAKRSNQNPMEGVTRELRRRWFRTMFQTYCSRALWNFGLPYVAKIMQITATFASDLQGRTPLETLMGETPDISQYLDFGFYNRVWFREDARLGETKLGRFLGVSQSILSLMSCWVLPSSGIPIAQATVQRVANLEAHTDQCKRRFDAYDKRIVKQFNEKFISVNQEEHNRTKPTVEKWEDLAGGDDIFHEEFSRVVTNGDVPEANKEFSPEEFDSYVNMELALDGHTEGPEFTKVTKRLKDKEPSTQHSNA